ncbi:MAG TPA: nucleoid-associated protein [Patescibacteria group bacterium]|nr:nucleoid-associated protein [Patescibacteria group bacterium]
MITDVSTVNIKKLIMHVLDNKRHKLTQSDALIELDSDNEFIDYIKNHIKKSVKHQKRLAAKFREPENNLAKTQFEKIFENNDNFIAASKELARLLFIPMSSNTHINPADLVICLYENEMDEQVVCLLLLDYKKNYFHKELTMPDGSKKITYSGDITSFPPTGSGLKNCCFVKKYVDGDIYDLLVVDRRHVENAPIIKVTQFFSSGLLNIEPAMDDTEKTRRFINKTVLWVQKQVAEKGLTKAQIQQIRKLELRCLDIVEDENCVNLDEFVEKAIKDETLKKAYREFLENEGLIDIEISVDKKYVETNVNRKKIITENGIEIKMPLSVYRNDQIFVQDPVGDGKYDFNIKNVEIKQESIEK